MNTPGSVPQSFMQTHPAVQEQHSYNFPVRGVITAVKHKDHPDNEAKQTVADVRLLDGFPQVHNAQFLYRYMNEIDGEEWTPAVGDTVIVQFLAGNFRRPIITGYLSPPVPDDVAVAAADAPQTHRRRNGTDEKIEKDGTRRIHVAASDFLEVVTDLTVTVLNGMTKFISKGKTLIQSQATVEIDGQGSGAVKGCVQGDCICAYTGKPHIMVSATVKASK